FLLAGLIGLTAYFLPLFQSASTPIVTSGGELINPVSGPTDPFTVLLLGSDDDSKFAGDQFNTQSMILVRVDPISKQATMMSIPPACTPSSTSVHVTATCAATSRARSDSSSCSSR